MSSINSGKGSKLYTLFAVIILVVLAFSVNTGCGGGGGGGTLGGSVLNAGDKVIDLTSTIDYSSLNSAPAYSMAPNRDIIANREAEIINIETGALIAKCEIKSDANSIISAFVSIPVLSASAPKTFALIQFKGDGKVLFRQLLGRIPYDPELSGRTSVSVKTNERSTAWAIAMLEDVSAIKSNYDVLIASSNLSDAAGKSNIELQIEKNADSILTNQLAVIESIVTQLAKIIRNKYITAATKDAIFAIGNTNLDNLVKNYIMAKSSVDSKVSEFIDPLKSTDSVMINGVNINLLTATDSVVINRLPVVYNASATLSSNEVTINYYLNDANNDTCGVKVLYYLSGSTQGLPLSPTRYSSKIGELNTIKAAADIVGASNITHFKIVPYDGKIEGYSLTVTLVK